MFDADFFKEIGKGVVQSAVVAVVDVVVFCAVEYVSVKLKERIQKKKEIEERAEQLV